MKLREIIVNAKNEDEAIAIAKPKLGIQEDYLMADKISEGQYKVFVNVSLNLVGKRFLTTYFENLEIDVQMEIRVNDKKKEINFNLSTNNNAIVIGREGKNLQALQLLLRLLLEQFIDGDARITLDVCGYSEYRNKKIELLALKTAKQVLLTKSDFKLVPMNSYDRRLVHSKLANYNKHIKTESDGVKDQRAVTIKYINE